jgi:hypothetical protein
MLYKYIESKGAQDVLKSSLFLILKLLPSWKNFFRKIDLFAIILIVVKRKFDC